MMYLLLTFSALLIVGLINFIIIVIFFFNFKLKSILYNCFIYQQRFEFFINNNILFYIKIKIVI